MIPNLLTAKYVERHVELDSTNSRAAQLASEGDTPLPAIVVAARQTAGRGRGANRWWSNDGALTFSLLIDASGPELPASQWPLVSLSAALTISDVLAPLIPGGEVHLKWPNDVYANGRKICGILVESPSVRPARLVIGIGLNVNNSLSDAPEELRAKATSLFDETGERFDIEALLGCAVNQFLNELASLARPAKPLIARWSPRCLLRDKAVWIDSGEQVIAGRCAGIDASGALLVDTLAGRTRLFAGVVKRWE